MCCGPKKVKRDVSSVYDSHGEMNTDEENETLSELPEHSDDPFLNRHVQYGVLGFRYETKDVAFTVYSSIESKTFCIIMKLSAMKN